MDTGDRDTPDEDRFPASEGCRGAFSKTPDKDVYYVVMFDNTFKRAGYFLAAYCKDQGKEYMGIMIPGTEGEDPVVYNNETLPRVLEDAPGIRW
jgi:hypothetical protein